MNGVVVKYSEPPEARKPKKKWRLYVFKGKYNPKVKKYLYPSYIKVTESVSVCLYRMISVTVELTWFSFSE